MSKPKQRPKQMQQAAAPTITVTPIVPVPIPAPLPLQASSTNSDDSSKLGGSDRIKLETAMVVELFKAHNDSARSTFQAIVTWYTFFITINVLAGGWFMSSLSKGDVISRWLLIPFASSFVIAAAIAIFVALRARRAFRYHADSANRCLSQYYAFVPCDSFTRNDLLSLAPAISLGLYLPAPLGMAATFACCAACWISDTAYSMWIEAGRGPVPTPQWIAQLLTYVGL